MCQLFTTITERYQALLPLKLFFFAGKQIVLDKGEIFVHLKRLAVMHWHLWLSSGRLPVEERRASPESR